METRKININDAPKWFKAIMLLAPVLGILLIDTGLNNDFYFLYPTGEYILNNGFPVTDFLSMHSSMGIIVQQWMSAVAFYLVYSRLGQAGLVALLYLCYALLCVLVFWFCNRVSENFFISAVCAFVCDLLMAITFIRTRPQIFTYLILLAALCVLEAGVKSKSIKPLIALPFLSVLLINFHAAMWPMLFVLASPYLFAAMPIKLGKFRQDPEGGFWALFAVCAVSFAAGFFNPYGLKAMFYMFSTVGHPYINQLIGEMAPVYKQGESLIILGALLAGMLIATLKCKSRSFSSRFVLLFFGTLLLALMNFRSYAMFFIAGIPAFGYCVKNIQPSITVTEKEEKGGKGRKALAIAMVIILAVVCGIVISNSDSAEEEAQPEQVLTAYGILDDFCEILEPEKDNLVLYTGYEYGAYMEYKGYHPFIDARAELFVKRINGEEDYIKELCDVLGGRADYKPFFEKYGFNYFIVNTGEGNLYEQMMNDGDYELIKQESVMCLFKKV